jgi:exopolysaccharide biosynthesis polyprenyl glycosylphosphotransferase
LRRGACLKRIMILAESVAEARFFAAKIERRTGGRIRSVACAALPGSLDRPANIELPWLRQVLAAHSIDHVVLVGTNCPNGACALAQGRLQSAGIDTIILPGAQAPLRTQRPAWQADPSLDLLRTIALPLGDGQAAFKRTFDIISAGAALIALAPVFAGVAIAIKLDSVGPVFFKQIRVGLNGNEFLMWKFRTMHVQMEDPTCRRQTSRNDVRVTRVGRTLRRTSLDELPQLFNVLWGDMSVVGPRPHADGMTVDGRSMSELAQGYSERLQLKPGITGWAQVNGCRGEITSPRQLRRRIALDCYYIENWSPAMDVMIIFRTISLMIGDRHAY